MKINRVCCIGAGYVGGPTMAVIAHECPDLKISVIDKNTEKIKSWNTPDLDNLPVYEPGLSKIIEVTRNKNLFFRDDFEKSILEAEMIFMAVNTPTKKNGKGKGYAADLSNIEECAKIIGQLSKSDKIIVEKSTLPVRTAEKIKEVLKKNNTNNVNFEIISNPEFLAEGTAIKNLYKSDRVLIGGENTKRGRKAIESLIEIYSRWIPLNKILKMNVWSAELSKLASNAMLAQRISSINSISAICEKTGASIEEVSLAVGMDKRIGKDFLKSSPGFGGSCFQKDILNLVYLCRNYGLEDVADYWEEVIKINDYQKKRFAKKIINHFNNELNQKCICILGWAFKKDTNDSRESASIYVCRDLLIKGARIHVYDPMVSPDRITSDIKNILATENIKNEIIEELISKIKVFSNLLDAAKDSEAILILTEWDEFIKFDWKRFISKSKKNPYIFDSRNIVDKNITKRMFSIGN